MNEHVGQDVRMAMNNAWTRLRSHSDIIIFPTYAKELY